MVFNGVIFYNVECIKNSLLPTESKGQKKEAYSHELPLISRLNQKNTLTYYSFTFFK
mgnify:FL=1